MKFCPASKVCKWLSEKCLMNVVKYLNFLQRVQVCNKKNWQGNFPKNHDITFLWCIEQVMKTANLAPKIVKNVLPAGCQAPLQNYKNAYFCLFRLL